MKGGVVVVGNETTFDSGEGVSINATDVLEASKWVFLTVRQHIQYIHTKEMKSITTSKLFD